MPTPGERRALMFVAAIAALGVAMRGCGEWRADRHPPAPGDPAALARQLEAVDSAVESRHGGPKKRKGGKGRRVPGSEPASDAASDPSSDVVPPRDTPQPDKREAYWRRRERADSARAAVIRRQRLSPNRDEFGEAPGRRPFSGGGRFGGRPPNAVGPVSPVDLDIAPVDEIASVPRIGPALARRIVADRVDHGPFGSIEELQRVRGIGAPLARRLQPYVTFSLPPRLDRAGEPKPVSRTGQRKAP